MIALVRNPGLYDHSKIWLVLGIAILCAGTAHCSPCNAPASIAAKLKPHPSAEGYSELGIWLGERRQFGCAAEAFQAAFNLDPHSARVAYMLGLSLYSSGEARRAILPLQQAVQLDPESLDAHLTLGMAFDQLMRKADSEKEWRSALAIDPQSRVALEFLSKDLLSEGDFESVIALLEPAVNSERPTSDIVVNLSVAYSKTGRPDDAARILSAFLQDHPSSLSVAKALTAALVLQHRTQEAVNIIETAVKRHPDDVDTQALYLHSLMLNGDFAKALQVGPAMLARFPRDAELLYLNGTLERQVGDYAVARRHLELAVSLNPNNFEFCHSLGVLLLAQHEYPAARRQLALAESLRPDVPEVHFELAKVMRATGDADGARKELELYQQMQKAQSDRTQSAWKAELGDRALALNNLTEAIALYREAITFNPGEPLLPYKLAMALDKAGDTAAELIALRQAVQIDPNMAAAQNQLGYLASRNGDIEEAESRFQLAVHASPRNAKAWMNLAATLCIESKWQEARDAIGHVLQLDPANTAAKQLTEKLDAIQAAH